MAKLVQTKSPSNSIFLFFPQCLLEGSLESAAPLLEMEQYEHICHFLITLLQLPNIFSSRAFLSVTSVSLLSLDGSFFYLVLLNKCNILYPHAYLVVKSQVVLFWFVFMALF